MNLVDTHCHIHDSAEDVTREKWAKAGSPDPDDIIKNAKEVGVTRLICVGTTPVDSRRAVDFVRARPGCWASIGIHPHEAKTYVNSPEVLDNFAELASKPKVVAVGECGLDYYYQHSPKEAQAKMLRFQIELALKHDLPMIFHVRDAFDDFWPIFDDYRGVRGVIHSFTAGQKELARALELGLFIGLNGIVTFTKNPEQLAAARQIPLDRLLLETDAPFLTPVPHRGTICEPKHVRVVAEFLADLRGETLENLAKNSTQNACKLFGL